MLPLVLALQQSPFALLDASAAAHARLTRYSVSGSIDARVPGRRQATQFDLAVDGTTVRLRVREPRLPGRGASDRTYFFRRNQLVAYDAMAGERLARPIGGGTNLQRVASALGEVPDLVALYLEPVAWRRFLNTFRSGPAWRRVGRNGLIELSRSATISGGTASTTLGFDARTRLTRSFRVVTPTSRLNWSIRYGTPGPISFAAPAGARAVRSFTAAAEPPRYESRAAERITKAMLTAYGRLRQGTIVAQTDEGRIRMVMDGRKFREERPGLTYVYDGRNLSVLNRRTGTFSRGAAVRSTVPDLVTQLRGEIDPLSRQILQARVPFRELLGPELSIAVAGAVTVDGVSCDILRMTNARSRISVFVRSRDRLVHSVTTDTLDQQGRTLVSSTRGFRYANLNRPQAAAEFNLRPATGQRVSPLPKLKLY